MTPEKGSPGVAQGEKVAKVVAQDEIKGASTDGVAAEKEPVKVPVSVAPAQVQEAPKETAGRSDEGGWGGRKPSQVSEERQIDQVEAGDLGRELWCGPMGTTGWWCYSRTSASSGG